MKLIKFLLYAITIFLALGFISSFMLGGIGYVIENGKFSLIGFITFFVSLFSSLLLGGIVATFPQLLRKNKGST